MNTLKRIPISSQRSRVRLFAPYAALAFALFVMGTGFSRLHEHKKQVASALSEVLAAAISSKISIQSIVSACPATSLPTRLVPADLSVDYHSFVNSSFDPNSAHALTQNLEQLKSNLSSLTTTDPSSCPALAHKLSELLNERRGLSLAIERYDVSAKVYNSVRQIFPQNAVSSLTRSQQAYPISTDELDFSRLLGSL